MSENSPLSEEILPGSVSEPELGVTDEKGPDKCVADPLVSCHQQNAADSESTSSTEDLRPMKATLSVKQPSAEVNGMEPSDLNSKEKKEMSFSVSQRTCEARGTTCPGFTEETCAPTSKTDQPIQTEVELRNDEVSAGGDSLASGHIGMSAAPPTLSSAKGSAGVDSLASGHLGMEVAPSTLASLRAHLQAMVRDERDFVHTLNTKLTRLEGVVRHVRQEKDNLAAEFQDLEDHVDELNGGVRAFDAEMRNFSHADAIFDSITEGELRRTDSRFSFDMPELGVSFPDSGRRSRRGLWSRGKRWLRKKTGKVTPLEEEDLRELAADAAIKLEAFLQEKL